MLSVFGDESHDERNERVFAVAGLFGSEEEWERTKNLWLQRTGGRVFHAAQCEADRGNPEGNSRRENLRLFRDLTRIICDSRLLGFGSAVDVAGFRAVFPGTDPQVPYYMCFRDVVMYFADRAYHSLERQKVKFTFDRRSEVEFNAGVLYRFMVDLPEWKHSTFIFGEISFASRELPEIQIADLVVRETMKDLDNRIGPVHRNTRGSMRALIDSRRFQANYLTREHFEEFLRHNESEMAAWCENYGAWLAERNIIDSISSRQRYSIEVDIPAFRSRREERHSTDNVGP